MIVDEVVGGLFVTKTELVVELLFVTISEDVVKFSLVAKTGSDIRVVFLNADQIDVKSAVVSVFEVDSFVVG